MNQEFVRMIVELHRGEDRQGPGSVEVTKKAMAFIPALASGEKGASLLDLGCGTGGQTLTLAENSAASIVAVDIIPDFVSELEKRAEEAGLSSRIEAKTGSMTDLALMGFAPASFDCIWCEGAMYHAGVESALALWADYLKPGGFVAFSDLCWLTDTRPEALDVFWNEEYPDIATVKARRGQIAAAGYALVDDFVFPDDAWMNYYLPLGVKARDFLAAHAGSQIAKEIIVQGQEELQMYLQYKDYYGYVFFVARKA